MVAALLMLLSTTRVRRPQPLNAPVALVPLATGTAHFGPLEMVAAWEIVAPDRRLGGFSAFAKVAPEPRTGATSVVLLTDSGRLLSLRIGADRRLLDQRWDQLTARAGQRGNSTRFDTESIVARRGGGWIVGLEAPPRLALADDQLRATRFRRDPPMRRWTNNSGPEAMTWLADGRLLVLSERLWDDAGGSVALTYGGDPFSDVTAPSVRRYATEDRGAVTDATALHDGRVLVLHRSFGLPWRWDSAIAVVDARQLRGDGPIEARLLARVPAGDWQDNYEGIAVTHERGERFIWLVSDDNAHRWQRSLLLKLRWPE